jgi:hypothetical protein
MTVVFAMSLVATLAWGWTGGVDQLGLPFGPSDPTVSRTLPGAAGPAPAPGESGLPAAGPSGAMPSASSKLVLPPPVDDGHSGSAGGRTCRTGWKLVPTCGILWGVAPGAFTDKRGVQALATFEQKTERHQDIFHAYHSGEQQLFPTPTEIAISRQPGKERILLLNWRATGASWAAIAKGDKTTDAFLDRLAAHIKQTYPEQFFFTVHHEAENAVEEKAGSGFTAKDYAAMFRHVVQRLRGDGVDNLVTVLVHMSYVPYASQSWFDDMYPGDDVIDWIGFDTYAYSDPGYGHGDFAELLNRRSAMKPNWPGFYNWAVRKHPDKPLMVAEWGVWSSAKNPGHKADFYRAVGREIGRFPDIRAMVAFDTPHNQRGWDSRVDATPEALKAYRWLGKLPVFQVDVQPALP